MLAQLAEEGDAGVTGIIFSFLQEAISNMNANVAAIDKIFLFI